MLSSFENQVLIEKLDTINKSLIRLEKRVKDLEDINLNYLSTIEDMNKTLQVLTGEVVEEINKNQEEENEIVAIVTFPDTYKKGGDLN
jgi:hypothetical protein